MKTYRVHVYDYGDQGRWLAQHDFAKRPTREQIEAAMPVLGQPGRYEVRINVARGDSEQHLAGWLQGEPVASTSSCSHCGCEIKPDTRPLNEIMEFDHPVQIGPDGTVTDHVPGVYAPELVMETDEDGQILDEHEKDYTEQARSQGWELLTGWTGQHGYRGPVMHPSEFVGGALADHIRETPGTYVVFAVECDISDPAGWAIARRIEE